MVVGGDDSAIGCEVGGSGIGPTDEGGEEYDLAVGVSVEVAAVDEVFGVAIAVVVVDVCADIGEPGGI